MRGKREGGLRFEVGDRIELSDGEDSAWRRDGFLVVGVAGTMDEDRDRSNPGVWIVRFGGRRRLDLGIGCMGEGGAERFRPDSTIGAVDIGGDREQEFDGNRSDRFFKFLALRVGESDWVF